MERRQENAIRKAVGIFVLSQITILSCVDVMSINSNVNGLNSILIRKKV